MLNSENFEIAARHTCATAQLLGRQTEMLLILDWWVEPAANMGATIRQDGSDQWISCAGPFGDGGRLPRHVERHQIDAGQRQADLTGFAVVRQLRRFNRIVVLIERDLANATICTDCHR